MKELRNNYFFRRLVFASLSFILTSCTSGNGGNGNAPAFSLSAPTAISIEQARSNTVKVTIERTKGFAGSVSLELLGQPAGVTASFEPAVTDGSSSTLTLAISADAATGPSNLTIKGSAGNLSATTKLELTVLLAGDGGDNTSGGTETYAPDGAGEVRQATVVLPGESEPTQITFEVLDGLAIYQGDIILGEVDKIEVGPSPQSIVITGSDKRWDGNTVPYEVSGDLEDTVATRIDAAIDHWEANTSLRFVERSSQFAYVEFVSGDGCSSQIGKEGGVNILGLGGKQEIRLSAGCSTGSIIHEIGHSVGLWHEQSRSDRNEHIEVLFENIQDGKGHNFELHDKDGTDVGAYDHGSIMHYGMFSFGKKDENGNTLPTIQTVPPGIAIGQRSGLSSGDLAAISALYPAGPFVDFFEGNGATQDVVCSVMISESMSTDFQEHGECDNDEARSLVLFDAPAGRVLRLFDSPAGSREDDWVEIVVKRDVEQKQIGSFETSFEDDDVRVTYIRNDGLDGKVSHLEVASSPSGPLVTLYEGNNAEQNLVCALSADQNGAVNFQSSTECDNDETRSLVLYNLPAGRVIRLYDSPSGSLEDDWTEIIVKRSIGRKAIGSFELSFDDDDVRLMYHRNNGLDGKVSRAEFSPTATGPHVAFYEGNNAEQNLVCTIFMEQNSAINFQSHSECDNDEARSMVLYNVPAGRVLRLYDSPSGDREDDWLELEVLDQLAAYVVPSFENDVSDSRIRLNYFRNNGLDGKVSRLEVGDSSSVQGILSFFEGNNASQNKVCDLSATPQTVNFQEDGFSCDNDEARSMVLTNVRAGFTIEVFDSPSCSTGDDWTRIVVKQNVASLVVGSFEQSISTAAATVAYFSDNGLDGKVSCARISYEQPAGNLALAIKGLPDDMDAEVRVSGPGGYESGLITETITLTGLLPGTYSIEAESVATGGGSPVVGTVYSPNPSTQDKEVKASETTTATVLYRPPVVAP